MENLELLNQFLRERTITNNGFYLRAKNDNTTKKVHVLVRTCRNAVYYYAASKHIYNPADEAFDLLPDVSYMPVAVETLNHNVKQRILILDSYLFRLCFADASTIPPGVVTSAMYVKHLQDLVNERFPLWYESLDPSRAEQADILLDHRDVRMASLGGQPKYAEAPRVASLNNDVLPEIFCLGRSETDWVENFLNARREKFLRQKAYIETVTREAAEHPAATEQERNLYLALIANDNAKFVTVTFRKNDKEATEKMENSRLQSILKNNNDVDYWDFPTDSKGVALMDALGCEVKAYGQLFPTDIVKVTYKRKTIFESQ